MARKTSRLDLRKAAEAAESRGEKPKAPAKKKAAGTTRTRTKKEKPEARKRLVWVVYDGSMKEQGRFLYDQLKEAEERIEQLKQKSNRKMYFIQPVKELLGEGGIVLGVATATEVDDEPVAKKPRKAKREADDDDDSGDDQSGDDDDDGDE